MLDSFTTFALGLFSCLFVLALFVQDRTNRTMAAALMRRDATTRALVRMLAGRPAWELAAVDVETITAGSGEVYAVVRLRKAS